MEDRSALFNQLKGFSQRKLKKVETKVVTGLGEQLVEKRGAKGLQVLSGAGGAAGEDGAGQELARKLDLQVGMVLPGLLMGSDDVATDKSSLESYGVTHILNLAANEVRNKFEDDYNYKDVSLQDSAESQLERVLDDCFDFIDDGRHYGNVLVHCRGTIGLSRSTAVCIAYLMAKENQAFQEAWNNVKEARSFVKPNEGFQKQLKDYEVKLRGAAKVKESGIDDPFALRKKQEIEQEKAMVAGAASVKNRMKMFGANLGDPAGAPAAGPRSKSVSPSPYNTISNKNNNANSTTTTPRPPSKWSTNSPADASKSMTPEPRSWRQQQQQQQPGPPPPPPPMPAASLHDKSIKPTTPSSQLPPPPPPPPPSGDLLRDKPPSSNIKSRYQPTQTNTTSTPSQRKSSVSSGGEEDSSKRVFGRRPPPPMKLRGGLSMERQDSVEASENVSPSKGSVQPPKLCVEIDRAANFQQLKSSFSGQQLQQNGQCMTAMLDTHRGRRDKLPPVQLDQRCPSPLVLLNNVTPSPQVSLMSGGATGEALSENPFKYWQNTQANRRESSTGGMDVGQAPKRTVSLGPKRPRQIGEGLLQNLFLRQKPGFDETKVAVTERRNSFSKAARELQSSLTELNNLIHSPELAVNGASSGKRPPLPATSQPPPVPPHRNLGSASQVPITISSSTGGTASAGSADSEENREPRYVWQEDLANWKASSSVNDLRSMFAKVAPSPVELPPVGSSHRPRLASTSNVLRRTPWQNLHAASAAVPTEPRVNRSVSSGQPHPESDYAIRRTVSSASSVKSRPVLRNPYRSQYS